MEYNTDLFDAATIDRMLGHFQTLLRAVVADPDAAGLRAADPARGRTPAAPGRMERDTAPMTPPIAASISSSRPRPARTPDAVAVVCGDRCLTYGSWTPGPTGSRTTSGVAGSGPDVIVGIGLDRSPELAVGLLGILKAGGAFLPLDPDYPRDRLAFMLEDAEVPVLLTRERLRDGWPAGGFDVICLDTDREVIGEEPGDASGWRCEARERGLRHLHVGLDGPAAGGRRPAPGGGQPPHRGRSGSSASARASGCSSSPPSASTSPSRRSSPPGSPAPRWSSVARRSSIPIRFSRWVARRSRSPSWTSRRPTGTPGPTGWPAPASPCPNRFASSSWAARRHRRRSSRGGRPSRRAGSAG